MLEAGAMRRAMRKLHRRAGALKVAKPTPRDLAQMGIKVEEQAA